MGTIDVSIAIVRDQSSIARLAPSLVSGSQKAEQPAKAAAVPSQAGYSGDPRSLAALSQALASFLDQVNSATSTSSPSYRDVAAAYADNGDAAPAQAPAAANAAKPADHAFSGRLGDLKASFDSLFTSLQGAGASAPVGPDAHRQIKADVADFVGGLTRIADELGRPAQQPATAPVSTAVAPASVAAAPAATASAAPEATVEAKPAPAPVRTPLAMQQQAASERPAQRQSVFAQLGERFQRHFEEL